MEKINLYRWIKSLTFVLISALLQSFVIQTFVQSTGLLSGGFSGLAILIDRITSLYGIHISTALALICLNIPVAILCSKSISIKFTFFSLLQVFLMSAFLQFINYNIILFDEVILNVIFGGILNGLAVLIALKGNASTGGTDFIALYISNKTNKSIWSSVFIANCIILFIFGFIFGWNYAGYSVIFQYCSTSMISVFHRHYDRVTLQITTQLAHEIMDAYVHQFKHGISCIEAIGGYSREKMFVLHTVISSYEEQDIVSLIKEIDSNVIINVIKTENFYGGFYRAPLD